MIIYALFSALNAARQFADSNIEWNERLYRRRCSTRVADGEMQQHVYRPFRDDAMLLAPVID